MIPGEWLLSDEPVEINVGRRGLRISVKNTGDRAIQVGSHFHFFEVNRALEFDRTAAVGMRLDVPSGQSVRFEPGDERDVDLVEFGGAGLVLGFNALFDGAISAPATVQRALEAAGRRGFLGARPLPLFADGEGSREAGAEALVGGNQMARTIGMERGFIRS
jgi:urease subunit beta/urease subunit gamma/beta